MQKQIQDFEKITGLVPNDLFLISHVGKTASTSLATVIAYTNAQVLPSISSLTNKVNALSSLNPAETARLTSSVSSLSSGLLSVNLLLSGLSVDTNTLNSYILSLSASLLPVISEVLYLSSRELSITSDVSRLSSDFLNQETYNLSISSNVLELSAQLDSLETTFNTVVTDGLSAAYEIIIANSPGVLTDFYEWKPTFTSTISSLSSVSDQLISSVSLLSAAYSSLSAFPGSLNEQLTGINTSLSSYQVIINSISSSYITFGDHSLQSNGTITISPSSEFIISTHNSDNSKTNNWVFDSEGVLNIPGTVIYSSDTATQLLDTSLSVQKLNSGTYTLPDGAEGQIMHFVPCSNTAGDTLTQIYIENARFWVIDNLGHKFAVASEFYWIPWVLNNHRLDPVYDIFPSIATAIFTDGAWNISTGGRNW